MGQEFGVANSQVRFSWDKASQGFKQTGDCEDLPELPRWTDNGDGTATDNTTGLIWELKTDDGSIHDVGNRYEWSDTGVAPDGGAFVDFLGTLNGNESTDGVTATACFADKCDWRLPTIGELTGILDESVPGCAFGPPCTRIPGAVGPFRHLSSTGDQSSPVAVWVVDFDEPPHVHTTGKSSGPVSHVRAVRGGS